MHDEECRMSIKHVTSTFPVLVAGSTGLLGAEVAKELRASGHSVRALVRSSSDPARQVSVAASGAQLAFGDLKDEAGLAAICSGVRAVVSTATALMSRVEGDSIERVDLRGQLNLVDAAEQAGVEHFVFVSFPPIGIEFEFQRAKRAVETRLREGKMAYTIIHAASFAEIWLSPMLGFAPAQGHARIFGDGTRPSSWISIGDVARFSAASVDGEGFQNKTIALGGPDALSYHDILELFARHGAREVTKEYIPESGIEAQLRAAEGPTAQALAALTLATARGQVSDSSEARRLWSGDFTRIDDLVARLMAPSQSA
jgi:uncharacterized protein YbjT (DUF2867 family)